MIDTIKVKIPINISDWAKVQEKAKKNEKSDQEGLRRSTYYDQLVMDKRAKVNITLGNNQDSIFVEFSIPKYLYGHNVYILKPDEVEVALDNLQDILYDRYNIEVPDYQTWLLRRLDFNYAWRFVDDEIAMGVLTGFKTFSLPKKKLWDYGSTLYFKGATKTIRIYLKHPEFMAKDYKELKRWGYIELAERIAEESKGVLRYEIELHDEAITALFGYKDVPVYKLLEGFDMLQFVHDEFFDLVGEPNEEVQSLLDLYNFILHAAPRRQAWPLFSQWVFSVSDNPVLKEALNTIPRSTRKRNEKFYREFGLVGLPFMLPFRIRLEIPSPYEPVPKNQ